MRKGSFLFILSLSLALQVPLLAQRDTAPEEQQTESKRKVKEKKVQEESSDDEDSGSTDPAKKEKKVKATVKAQAYYDAKEYSLAIDVLKEAFGKEKSREKKTEIAFMMGECYRNLLNYKQAASQYKRALKLGYGAEAQYRLAEMTKSQGEYEEAILEFEALKAMSPGDKRAEQGIETCRLAAEWKNSPSRYIVEPTEELNTRDRDMTPVYSGRPGTYDEVLLVSSREGATGNKEDGWTGESFMDIWMAAKERKSGGKKSRGKKGKSPEMDDAKFSTPVPLDPIINSKDHEGTMTFDSRRKELYITRCRVEKYVSLGCAIYVTSKKGQTWEEPELVVLTEDSTKSVGHPSFSADDKIMYFAGNLDGAVDGSKDLWMTTFDRRSKKWNPATNLGNIVNTAGDELFPFVHDDGFLYFASNGLPGMGGLDIFRVKLGEDGMPVGEVENMKYPINTEFEDFGIILEGGGAQKGFITSNRNSKSGDDIYTIFEVPLNFQLEGVVTSNKDGKPVPQVTVRLDGSDGTSIVANTDGSGRYIFERDKLKENTNYKISFEKKKFLNGFSDATTVGVPFSAFEYNSSERYFLNTLKVNKGIEPIEVPIVLPNVLFDLAKWDLRPEAMVSLDSVVAILNNNPNVVIELRSHTDYTDTDERNKILSQHRADTCVKYIITKGIAADRLVAVGKGEEEPFSIPEAYKGFGAGEFTAGEVLTESYIKKLAAAKQTIANQINRRTDFKVLRDDYVPNRPAPTVDGTGAKEKVKEVVKRPKGEFYVLENARESFGVVAKKSGISVRDLKLLNGGLRGVRPFEGLELKITLDGDYDEYDATHYRVENEKSLKEIAKKLSMDDKDLEDLNPNISNKDLVPGLVLLIE
jgi:peptidoglycan-associated lipoprotein